MYNRTIRTAQWPGNLHADNLRKPFELSIYFSCKWFEFSLTLKRVHIYCNFLQIIAFLILSLKDYNSRLFFFTMVRRGAD
jgi:hypothetical protein